LLIPLWLLSKEFRQYLLIYHFLVKSLAQDLYSSKIILTEGEEVDAVFLFINETQTLFRQLIKAVGLELS